MNYITKIKDCDNYLIDFLPMADIINLTMINTQLAELVSVTKIYLEYIQLKDIPKKYLIICCYKKGLINILKNYHRNGKNIFIPEEINLVAGNGHIAILNWFKDSGFKFNYNNSAINLASDNGLFVDILTI
jgi:hypothetical protein